MGPKDAGELKDRIRVDRRASTARDIYGNAEGAWQTLITSRAAKLEPLRARGAGGENVIAARLQGVSLWDCWIRYDSATKDIGPGDRIVNARDTTKTFNIKLVEDMDRSHHWLFLQLEQGTADG